MSVPMSQEQALQNVRAALPQIWQEAEAYRQAPGLLGRLIGIFGGLLAALLAAALVIPMGGAVIGPGQVGVQSKVKRVAHPTGGVIKTINVTNGQHVEQGQLLISLDDHVTGSDAQYASLTVEQLLAEKARLEAERLGRTTIEFPAALTQANSDSARAAMLNEERLFHLRVGEASGLASQLVARVSQYNEEIHGFESQIAALRQQRKLIEPERQGVHDLWDHQLTTINRLNQLERTAVDLDGNIAQIESQIAQTRAKITEAREQSIQMIQSRRVQAGNELDQVNATLNQQQQRSVIASDTARRSEIRAPYSGTIEKIAFSAVGDVIRAAEPIMEIVPDHDTMVVEAMVSPLDIDRVVPGQKANVRFSGFNRAATPDIPAMVAYVATDRTENNEAHQAFYMVRIELDQAALRREKLQLRSGMPAEVYIQTGNRSLMSYLSKPLRDQFARAFRDN